MIIIDNKIIYNEVSDQEYLTNRYPTDQRGMGNGFTYGPVTSIEQHDMDIRNVITRIRCFIMDLDHDEETNIDKYTPDEFLFLYECINGAITKNQQEDFLFVFNHYGVNGLRYEKE